MKKYNQILIKSNNKKQVYRLIEDIPGISRVQLAETLKLSKTTVSALVDELIQEGFVLDEGTVESSRQGRKPNSLVPNSQENGVVVINWHKDSLDISLVNSAMESAIVQPYCLVEKSGRLERMGERFCEFLQKYCQNIRIMGVCLIVPGMIDEKADRIISVELPDERNGN